MPFDAHKNSLDYCKVRFIGLTHELGHNANNKDYIWSSASEID